MYLYILFRDKDRTKKIFFNSILLKGVITLLVFSKFLDALENKNISLLTSDCFSALQKPIQLYRQLLVICQDLAALYITYMHSISFNLFAIFGSNAQFYVVINIIALCGQHSYEISFNKYVCKRYILYYILYQKALIFVTTLSKYDEKFTDALDYIHCNKTALMRT